MARLRAAAAVPFGNSETAVEPELPANVTLTTLAVAGLAACITRGRASGGVEESFLSGHLQAVESAGGRWVDVLDRYLRSPNASDRPLVRLAADLQLTTVELLAVALCTAVEHDVMVGRAVTWLQAPIGGSRPTIALLSASMAETVAAGVHPGELIITGSAVQSGLLGVAGDGLPLPERTVSVPLHIAMAVRGCDSFVAGTAIGSSDVQDVTLAASTLHEARRQVLGPTTGLQRTLVLRASSPAEGKAVAHAMAATLARRPLFIDAPSVAGLGPWAMLRYLVPVFCLDLAPGERKVLPLIPHYRGPVFVLCGPDGSVESGSGPAVSWSIPVPRRSERQRLWSIAIGDNSLAHELARDHRHGAGRIAHIGRLARHHAGLNGRSRACREDVVAASWTAEGAGLDALAQPLRQPVSDAALVTTSVLREQLTLLLERCRSRDCIADGLGPSIAARYSPGVRALFVGPSGTGKTLAAAWLATRLGLPLYRVDLAAVTSKYIGETEKNLAQLLARAEHGEIVLLFDEADSLFGKRTEIREANDRFANAQTNYLLQRIEGFDGISILTSNSRSRFDDAFSRRLDLIVEFPLPAPEERRALWLSHLGTRHSLDDRAINQLAVKADVCGGDIRNAVLTAASIAARDDRPIAFEDLVVGLTCEYRKLGRLLPVELLSVGHSS